MVVGTTDGTPVHLADVATVADGGGEPDDYVMHYPRSGQAFPAVTLSIAKRKGTNAIDADAGRRAQGRNDARVPAAARPERLRHARLRRDRGPEVERAPVAHVPRHRLGLRTHLARARAPRIGGRADGDSRHAGAHAVRLLPLRLHAEPHHALRADLLDRHPGRRRDCRRREHRAARADGARRRVASRRLPCAPSTKSAIPTILATLDGDRRDSADGVRRRSDGSVHAADSRRRVRRDGVLAGRRVRRHAVGSGATAAALARPPRRARGSPDRALSPGHATAHRSSRRLVWRFSDWSPCCWSARRRSSRSAS